MKDYSSYGPAYAGLKVRDDVYVPEPAAVFSGTDPFTRMAPIRGRIREIVFDENYPYLDKSFGARIQRFVCHSVMFFVAFPLNRLLHGLKIEGRGVLRKNRKLFRGGAMTICNHIGRWDMICVFQAMRFRRTNIPMYAEPFKGDDGKLMKGVGGIPIPDTRAGLKAFDAAMDKIHSKGQWIHIFPESCSWKNYSPIRPFKAGPFNMAYKYGLPIIPMVISFRPRTGIYRLFGKDDNPLITIHICEPLVPDTDKPRKTEAARLRDMAHRSMVEKAGIILNPWPSAID